MKQLPKPGVGPAYSFTADRMPASYRWKDMPPLAAPLISLPGITRTGSMGMISAPPVRGTPDEYFQATGSKSEATEGSPVPTKEVGIGSDRRESRTDEGGRDRKACFQHYSGFHSHEKTVLRQLPVFYGDKGRKLLYGHRACIPF